jgi:hypothetical protein
MGFSNDAHDWFFGDNFGSREERVWGKIAAVTQSHV